MASSSHEITDETGLSSGKKDSPIHPVISEGRGELDETTVKSVGDTALDDAAKYLANTRDGHYPPLTPEREKKLRKKIDSWMIPLVSGGYFEQKHPTNIFLVLTVS